MGRPRVQRSLKTLLRQLQERFAHRDLRPPTHPDREVQTHIDIDASPERCWAVLRDVSMYPEWNPTIARVHPLGTFRPGCRILLHLRVAATLPAAPVLARVVALTQSRELAWVGGVDGLALLHHYFRLVSTCDKRTQTRLEHGESFTGRLIPPIWSALEAHLRPRYHEFNQAFKERCEQ